MQLNSLLANVASIIQVRAQKKRLRFASDVDENLAAGIMADEKRLSQVLLNLLDNAVKFTQRVYCH